MQHIVRNRHQQAEETSDNALLVELTTWKKFFWFHAKTEKQIMSADLRAFLCAEPLWRLAATVAPDRVWKLELLSQTVRRLHEDAPC